MYRRNDEVNHQVDRSMTEIELESRLNGSSVSGSCQVFRWPAIADIQLTFNPRNDWMTTVHYG
jgi:hypothetical protein